jgi:hypothetical protein
MTRTPTPETVFTHAAQFHYAAGLLEKHNKARIGVMITTEPLTPVSVPCMLPFIVIIAFCAELYLKCLLMLETGNYVVGHDLERLYSQVSALRRARIKEFFNEVFIRAAYERILQEKGLPIDPLELEIEGALRRLNNAFVEYRYVFEGLANEKTSFGVDVVCGAVFRAIMEIKPEWQRILDYNCIPTTFLIH